MRGIAEWIGAVVLIASYGFTETIITAQDYAVDSDVVIESVVQEVKDAPRDTVNVVGDVIKYVADETVTAANGAAAVFKKDPVAVAERAAALETASAWDDSNDIHLRSYKIAPEVGEDMMAFGKAEKNINAVDVSAFFDGMDFPPRTSAYYRPEFQRLFVHQTMDNLYAIEDVLSEQHNMNLDLLGNQVEIETKFVEVNQSALNELGFSWTFGAKNGGDFELLDNLFLPQDTAILAEGLRTGAMALAGGTDPGVLRVAKTTGRFTWDLLISALEQADDADVLSAPRIVTRSGSKATIQVGEERMVPKRFDVLTQNTGPYVEPTDWDPELIGVTLEVTPELRKDDMIKLKLKPRVMDLVGYDDYQITPDNASMWAINGYGPYQTGSANSYFYPDFLSFVGIGGSGTTPTTNGVSPLIDVPSLHGQLPYFRVREVETQVTVADGSTVAMGGLIYDKLETFRDKVPVLGSIPLLGRLFRSEGERSIKRNLMIFVTATQVDVNGRRNADMVLKR